MACGPEFDGLLLLVIQTAAKKPLTFAVKDVTNCLTAGGAAKTSWVAE